MSDSSTPTPAGAQVPSPPSERAQWLLALSLGALGVGVLAAVLAGVVGRSVAAMPHAHSPAVLIAAAAPLPAPATSASVLPGAAVRARTAASPRASGSHAWHGARRELHADATPVLAPVSRAQQILDSGGLLEPAEAAIPTRWMEGFYPIYAVAQGTFGVNWLLIASIHRQESAFSTDPSTYRGLNFAGCCGGPMQFNVTNGPVSTWDLVRGSYRYGRRPAAYDHMTAAHPSMYDDFDSIMAAAHLLSADGAGLGLDGAAWGAAYDYYGHDSTGVGYADLVLARAIRWSQHGFCASCTADPVLIQAVHAAYGARVLNAAGTATTARAR